MSETSAQQWLQPIDTSALDPADPGVHEEIEQRWASRKLAVSPAEAYGGDPQGLETHRLMYDDLRRDSGLVALSLLLVLVGFLALLVGLTMVLDRQDGTAPSLVTGWILLGVTVVCVVGVIWLRIARRPAPEATRMHQELDRQVRLAAMAARNDAAYASGKLYSPGLTDIGLPKATPVMVDTFVAEGRLPAQWGNLAMVMVQQSSFLNPMSWKSSSMFIHTGPLQGYGLVRRVAYLAIGLPVRLPHIVIDSAPGGLKLGEGAVEVSIDDDFDAVFHVYAPQGYESDVRDLLPEEVRRGLAELAYRARITLTGTTLIVERARTDRFDQAEAWQAIWGLRHFVEDVWYPRLGEFVDQRAEQPKMGLMAYPHDQRPAPIADGGTRLALKPRPNVLAIAAIVCLLVLGALGRLRITGWVSAGVAIVFGLLVIALIVRALIRHRRVTRAREREIGPLDLR